MLSNKFISEARFGKLDFDNPTSSIVWLIVRILLPSNMSHIIMDFVCFG